MLFLLQLEDGNADIAVTVDELVAMLPSRRSFYSNTRIPNTWSNLRYRTIVVTANVNEAATGKTLSGSNTVDCTDRKYDLSFLDITPTSFKAGLTVSAYVRITDR